MSDRRVSIHDIMSCENLTVQLIAAVHSDRRSRSVDSGLVTDLDLPQRVLTTVVQSSVPPQPSSGTVVGSCDSGLAQHIEQDIVSVCCALELTDQFSDHNTQYRCCHDVPIPVAVTNNRQSWLLRLFESKLFDMSIAIQYLFNSKETGVQTYIGEFNILTYTRSRIHTSVSVVILVDELS